MADLFTLEDRFYSERQYKKETEQLVLKTNRSLEGEKAEKERAEIVREQLEAEKQDEWRENFLADNGTVFRKGFLSRTARVAGHEPVLKESDNKDVQSMYDKVTNKYRKAKKKIDKENRKMQKQLEKESKENLERREKEGLRNVAGDLQFLPVYSKNFYTSDQYEILREAASAFFEAKKKEGRMGDEISALKMMYSKLYAASEVEASYSNQMRAYAELMDDKDVRKDPQMQEEVRRRIEVLQQERNLAENRRRDLIGAMRTLRKVVNGTPIEEIEMSERQKGVLQSFYRFTRHTSYDDITIMHANMAKELQNDVEDDMRQRVTSKLNEGEALDDGAWAKLLEENWHYITAVDLDEEARDRLATQLVHSLRHSKTEEDEAVIGSVIKAHSDMIIRFDIDPYLKMLDNGDYAGLMRHMKELAKFEYFDVKGDFLHSFTNNKHLSDLERYSGLSVDGVFMVARKAKLLGYIARTVRERWNADAWNRGLRIESPRFDIGMENWKRMNDLLFPYSDARLKYESAKEQYLGNQNGQN